MKVRSLVWKFIRQERGFTLVEMMVTMLLMLVVMFALYSIFDMSLRVFSFGNDKTEAVENARLGMERMEREIRAAYPYDKAAGNNVLFPAFSTSQSPSIKFGNDVVTVNQKVDDVPSEEIEYTLNGESPASLLRNGQQLANFVEPGGLRFTYCKTVDNCNPAAPPVVSEAEVKVVHIELKVKVDRGLAGPATQTLETDVALRNRTGI